MQDKKKSTYTTLVIFFIKKYPKVQKVIYPFTTYFPYLFYFSKIKHSFFCYVTIKGNHFL